MYITRVFPCFTDRYRCLRRKQLYTMLSNMILMRITNIIYGSLFLITEKRNKYTAKRTVLHLPKEIREVIEKNEWKNKGKHPMIYDDELNALIVFDHTEAYIEYFAKKKTCYERTQVKKK